MRDHRVLGAAFLVVVLVAFVVPGALAQENNAPAVPSVPANLVLDEGGGLDALLAPLLWSEPAASHEATEAAGEVPTQCGGEWRFEDGASCNFRCSAGDQILIESDVASLFCDACSRFFEIRVRAACGGVIIECFRHYDEFGERFCRSVGEDPVLRDDDQGQCSVEGYQGGRYRCAARPPVPDEPVPQH